MWLPQAAPWLQAYVDQLLAFPSAAHDDLVDSTTQAVNYATCTGPMRVSTVHYGHGSGAALPPDPFADADMPKRRLSAVPGFR